MKKIILLLFLTLTTASCLVIAKGNIEAGKQSSIVCVACHGVYGNSMVGDFPKLAGQSESYLIKQLQDYKSDKRQGANMNVTATTLSEQDIMNLAAYFSSQKISENTAKADAETIAIARKIYLGGKKDTGTTACLACHGPNGKGIPSAKFPAISGQHAKYIANQLKAFRQFTLNIEIGENKLERANDYEGMMRSVTKRLTNVEIDALSQYIAGLY